MDAKTIIDGLIMFLGLVALFTVHEFGHAWMAWKCGDDTAKNLGRVTLNPLVHIDPLGSVVVPLLMIFSSHGQFVVGWAKPVPVTPSNLRNPRMDDLLVTLAGPWMNLLVAVLLTGLARVAVGLNEGSLGDICLKVAHLSLLLFYFNLLPIPPLDGARAARVLVGMSYETYYSIARYGFIVLIVVLQIPSIQNFISMLTNKSWVLIGSWFGVAIPI